MATTLTDAQKLLNVNVEMLQHFKSKQDAFNAGKFVAIEAGKSLLADTEATRLAGMETGAQVNVLEGVKVNGTALVATDKVVNVTVATGSADGTLAVNGSDVAVKGYSDLASQVSTLIGDDASKSARTIANEELAKQLIPENAAEALDTLGEIAAWIQAHPGDAATMNTNIGKLQAIVAGIGGEGDEFATVAAYVADAISDLDFSNELAKKVDKETGKSLLADTEIARLAAMSDGANKTEVSAETFTAGTKVATVTIDGTATEIKVPTVAAAAEYTTGLKVGSVSVNGTAVEFKIPTASTADIDALFA